MGKRLKSTQLQTYSPTTFSYIHHQSQTVLKMVTLLLNTLLFVSCAGFYLSEPINELQWAKLKELGVINVIAAFSCFQVSRRATNYGQVYHLWSIIPIVCIWTAAHHAGFEPRLSLISLILMVCGAISTYTFDRQGEYLWKFWTVNKDCRWVILEDRPEFSNTFEQGVFNRFFYFSVLVTCCWLNWTILWYSLLLVLFKSRAELIEKISAYKYFDYSDYQRAVPCLVPCTK